MHESLRMRRHAHLAAPCNPHCGPPAHPRMPRGTWRSRQAPGNALARQPRALRPAPRQNRNTMQQRRACTTPPHSPLPATAPAPAAAPPPHPMHAGTRHSPAPPSSRTPLSQRPPAAPGHHLEGQAAPDLPQGCRRPPEPCRACPGNPPAAKQRPHPQQATPHNIPAAAARRSALCAPATALLRPSSPHRTTVLRSPRRAAVARPAHRTAVV